MAQRVGRGIALFFHDRGTRGGSVVSSTPRPHFTPGKSPVPIVQEAGWAPGPVRTGGKPRPHRDSIPDRPARGQSLYRLSYPAHSYTVPRVLMNNTLKGKVHQSLILVPQRATVRVAHSTTAECFCTMPRALLNPFAYFPLQIKHVNTYAGRQLNLL